METTLRMLCGLLAVGLLFSVGACSHLGGTQDTLHNEDYRKITELKKKDATLLDEKALKNIPDMSLSEYESTGDRYLEQGNIESAFLYYYKALVLKPSENKVRYKLGRLFLRRGLAEDARNEFLTILNYDAGFALAYDGLGRSYLAMKDLQKAEENFRKALSLNDSSWEDHNFLGFILDQKKQSDEAITQYQKAIAIRPDLSFLFNNLGMSYLMKGEYEKAAKSFNEALKSEDHSEKVYNNLGVALFKSGKKAEAFEAFKRGAGGEAGAYNNLGYLYLHDGKYGDAKDCFDSAIELNPKYYDKAHVNLKRAESAGGDAAFK